MIRIQKGNTTYEFDTVKELIEFEKPNKPQTPKEPTTKQLKKLFNTPTTKRKYKKRTNQKTQIENIIKEIQTLKQPTKLIHLLYNLKIPVGGNYKKLKKDLQKESNKNKTFKIYYVGKRCFVEPLKKGEASTLTNPTNLDNITFREVQDKYQKIAKDILLNTIKTHSRITFQNEGFIIGIEDKDQWNDYIIEILQKAPQITKQLGVPNNFKIMQEGRQKYIIYQ